MRVYYDRDADVNLIKGKKVAIVGYGSQGHAHANNLRDSGVKDVVVGVAPGLGQDREGRGRRAEGAGRRRKRAEMGRHRDGADARRAAGAISIATIWAPTCGGAALAFAHGLNIHFKLIEPRPDIDVFMIAPKGPGHTVRSEYQRGGGVPCLVAVGAERLG